MTKKRGYAHTFPTNLATRIKREIDWVPPALDARLRAKCRREGLSLRVLTLTLWWRWVRDEIAIEIDRTEPDLEKDKDP
jgi:hypothetical protein